MKKEILFFGLLFGFILFLVSCESTPPLAPVGESLPFAEATREGAILPPPIAPGILPAPPMTVSEYTVLLPADLPPLPKTFAEFKEPPVQMLTQSGENFNAAFSSNGKKILFSSRNRPQHLQAQAYELNLENKKEKRVTHQDGDVIEARYLGDNKLVYVSTTDEQKENLAALVKGLSKSGAAQIPVIIQENNSNLPTEIYLANSDGSHIRRITDAKGFDGFTSNPSGSRNLIYTSFRNGNGELYLFNSISGVQQKLRTSLGADMEGQLSTDGKRMVWVNKEKNGADTRLMTGSYMAANPKALKLKTGIHQSPSFSPNAETILFSSNFENPNNSEIYVYLAATECVRKVTQNPAQDRAPSFSPDGKKILFTSTRSGQDQIYLMDFETSQACISAQ